MGIYDPRFWLAVFSSALWLSWGSQINYFKYRVLKLMLILYNKLENTTWPVGLMYSRTPLIRITWDGQPTGEAENPDNWIFFFWKYIWIFWSVQIYTNGYFRLYVYIRISKTLKLNCLKPNDLYSGRTAPQTSKRCILYIYSTNIGTEYFKHGIYSPFFPLQNAVCFIILTSLVSVLFTFYIQDVLKLKKK